MCDEDIKCKIKKVVADNGVIKPLLLNVDNRVFPSEELNNSVCSWYEDESSKSTRVVNFTHNSDENYQGSTKIGGNMCKTMLVLQNKKTNKVKLIEIGECRLARVLQKAHAQTSYSNEEMQTTYEENKSKLLKAFGSKKSNRASEIGSKTKINAECMNSQIQNTAADVTVDVRELELADSSVDTCLPICHRSANNAAGVYIIEDFLTQPELDSMEDEAFTIINLLPFSVEESGYSQFFIDSVDRLQNKIDIQKIKVLLFAESLIRFFNTPMKKLKKNDIVGKISPFSNLISKKIIEDYTVESVEGSRLRNVTMDDKIVIHIMVLVIIACDFSCNLEELSKYLPRFSVKKLGQIARALCLTTRDKITWFIKLPLPPTRSMFMRRKH